MLIVPNEMNVVFVDYLRDEREAHPGQSRGRRSVARVAGACRGGGGGGISKPAQKKKRPPGEVVVMWQRGGAEG